MNEFEKEKQKLSDTIDIVNNNLKNEQEALDKLYKEFVGDREDLWSIASGMKLHIKNLQASALKPYFARIDFISDELKKKETIYIGKNGINKNGSIVVTDWRAPISSLYYDYEIGKCNYEAPIGNISGIMDLKRQFEIEKGELLEYFDVDLVSNDELLQKYLNSNNDTRLKSIVATIQKEQNEVIRKKIFDNLIIQGVAGSGKTTVALHRIAYLVYNYIKDIKPSQYIVIGPNPVFLKYIKSVLPELDVDGVEQCTFEQLAKNYVDEDIKINLSDKKVVMNIAAKMNNDIDKFKCSMKYKEMIDKFLEVYMLSLTSSDLNLGEFKILDSRVIRNVFSNVDSNYCTDLKSRIEFTIDRLCRIIENKNDEIYSAYGDYSYLKFKNATTNKEKDILRKKALNDREEIRKNCRSTLRKYFSKAKFETTKLYKLFINSINDFDIYNYKHINSLKKETLDKIKNNEYDFEDLAALMYIKSVISPNSYYNRYAHTVVDEAQDLGEFDFFVLKKCLSSSTFSIFGDLAQSIYDYRGVDNWDTVNDVMFNGTGQIINFNKSYRTTSEIMSVADDVAESIGLGRSELVVRHGEDVKFTDIDSIDDIPLYVAQKIQEYKEKGYKTIAVISKTNLLSNYMNDDLMMLDMKIPNITLTDDLSDDQFNVCTISNQLSKGLEFDAVIINNASEQIYSSDSSLDMKLLYVAITRALHELDVVYSGELTKPLKKSYQKVKKM